MARRITDAYIRREFMRQFKRSTPEMRLGVIEALQLINLAEGGESVEEPEQMEIEQSNPTQEGADERPE